ncbi:MAG: nickel pincer cofactor biosynthesis protein LarC [Syntrophobacterales bacterium]|nr:MAG: nickel pincer cofactor biosynthesis protein LarC [Syntrophobacterales bacterium]
MRVCYLDCFSGISGNMVLGALIDIGLPKSILLEELSKLGVEPFDIEVKRDERMRIHGTHVKVRVRGDGGPQRSYREIKLMIEESPLDLPVKDRSLNIFHRLATAEAKVHGEKIDEVHFHEVGALDSIVDVVGAAVGMSHLAIERVFASRIPVGSGFVHGQHGRLPVPAPATLEILKGIPIYSSSLNEELVTPTGAAILTSLSAGFGNIPEMRIERVGYGMGDRVFEEVPNVLRIILGEGEGPCEGDRVWVVETDIDDMSSEIHGYLMEKLPEMGALDVTFTPIQMKKSRPGITIKILCYEAEVDMIIDTLFRESTSIGVRLYSVRRAKLSRKIEEVETKYGTVRLKVSTDHRGRIVNVMPEYEDCKRIAKAIGIPLKEVYREIPSKKGVAPDR